MPSPNEHGVPHSAAAEMLGVPEATTPAEARSRFLRRLEKVEFMPSPQQCAGAAVLGNIASSGGLQFGDSAIREARYETLRRKINAYAAQFWWMCPRERTENWRQLCEECQSDLTLSKWLNLLKTGLAVESREFDAKLRPASVFALIKEIFALRPFEQSVRIDQFLESVCLDPRFWTDYREVVTTFAPRLKALLPEVFARIGQCDYVEDRLLPERAASPPAQTIAAIDPEPRAPRKELEPFPSFTPLKNELKPIRYFAPSLSVILLAVLGILLLGAVLLTFFVLAMVSGENSIRRMGSQDTSGDSPAALRSIELLVTFGARP